MLDLLWGDDHEHGRVLGVDIKIRADAQVQAHPRVTLIEGDSVADDTFDRIRGAAGESPMILLDSDHSCEHVLAELRLYAELVPMGSYMIVNDTNIAGHPALADREAGPYEAVTQFLAEDDRFTVDRDCEKHMLTQSPRGFLRRI